jgi:ATP-binding cassette, subfamily B, multidrug efflux pump
MQREQNMRFYSPVLWRHLGTYKREYIAGSLILVLTNLLHVLLPSFIGKAVDLFSTHFNPSDLYKLLGLIIIVEFIKGLCRFGMRYILMSASWNIENDIRTDIFRHLMKLPAHYFNTTRTGDIIARATNDLTAARMMFGPAFMYTLNAVVLLPLTIAFMVSLDLRLTLYAIIPFPFIAFSMYRIGRTIHHHFTRVQETYSDISAHVQEDLNGIQVVKSYAIEPRELEKLETLSISYVNENKKVIRLQSFLFPLLDVFASAGVIILLWAGGIKVINGELSLGTLVSLVMYIGILIWPAMALGWVTALVQRGMASLERIQEIFDQVPEPILPATPNDHLSGNITVEHLTFGFIEGKTVLNDISFSVKSGMTVALIGRTGSGKSTLMGILAGIYRAPQGTIRYDDRNIEDIPLSVLRSSIAMTPQETFLFSDTIAENISFGRADADEQHIEDAATQAAIAEEIKKFPAGYESILGERGINVSGGQRQRIAIARALISDAPILFFDDSLSNVDTLTEKTILFNIKQRIAEKTAIIVTQRLGAMKDADMIIYLKDGHIAEQGSHEILMALDGEYAELFREQELIEALQNPELHQ